MQYLANYYSKFPIPHLERSDVTVLDSYYQIVIL